MSQDTDHGHEIGLSQVLKAGRKCTETDPAGSDWKRPMKRPDVDAALAAAARSMLLAFWIISSHMRFTCPGT